MLIFLSHRYIVIITVKYCLYSQPLKRKCHIALGYILTQHCSRFSYIAETSRHVRLGSVYVWCLVTKRSMSRVRERGSSVAEGGEREGWKAQETTALISLPGESHIKGTGVTQSIQA